MTSEQPRVLLVDDNEGILNRAAAILSKACAVVGMVRDGAAALEAIETTKPDVVVLDVSLPRISGIEVAQRLRRAGSAAAVVFLTVHYDEDFVRAAHLAGGLSYALEPRLASELLMAVMEAYAGRPYVSEMR